MQNPEPMIKNASLFCAALLAGMPLLHADLLLNDTFSGSGPLNGDAVEYASQGSYTWAASGPTGGYYRNGGVLALGTAGADATAPTTRMAWVNRTLGANETFSLTLDVWLTSNAAPVAWTSISFLNAPASVYDSAEWNTGELTLRLLNTGEWWVLGLHYSVNSQDILAHGTTGSAPGFVVGGWNQLRLVFDNSTNMASAYINGGQVMAPRNPYDVTGVYPDLPSFEPTITASGFQMYGGSTQGSLVDDFSLSVVPEPSVMALLAGAALVRAVRRRR